MERIAQHRRRTPFRVPVGLTPKMGARLGILFVVLGIILAAVLNFFVGDRYTDRNELVRRFNTAFFSRDFVAASKVSCRNAATELERTYEQLVSELGHPLSVHYVNNTTFSIGGSRKATRYRHLPVSRVNGVLLVCPTNQNAAMSPDSLFLRS